jgi:hypothetical protein
MKHKEFAPMSDSCSATVFGVPMPITQLRPRIRFIVKSYCAPRRLARWVIGRRFAETRTMNQTRALHAY